MPVRDSLARSIRPSSCHGRRVRVWALCRAQESGFVELRRRYLNFAFPATIAFMAWYILYVVCNNWARDFMNTEVIGNINVALVWGLLQFVSTFAIAYFYARHAKKSLDPLASKLRDEFDRETGR